MYFVLQQLSEILHKIEPGFDKRSSKYTIERGRESTARVVVWREFDVGRSYTLESTFSGCNIGQLEGQHLGTHHLFNIGLTFLQALMSLDQNLDNVDNYPELCQTSIEKDKQSMKITRWVERSLAVYRAVHQQRFLSSHTGWTVAKHGTLSPPSMALFWSFLSAPQNHFLDVSSILILSFRLVISMPQAWSIIRCVLLGQNQNRDQITLLYCNSAYHNIPQILYKVFSCLQINVMVLHDTLQYSHIFVLRSRIFLEIFLHHYDHFFIKKVSMCWFLELIYV